MAVKPPTYSALLEAALRAEETLVERNTVVRKRKKFSGSFSTPTQSRGSSSFRGSGFQRVGSEAVFEEEEVLHREDRDRFPLVEEDMVLEEDLEATL